MVAREFDFGAIAVEPTGPAMREFNRVFEGVFRGDGRNMRAGRQLPAQFDAAGPGAADDQRGLHFRYRRWPTCSLAFMTVSMPGAELGLANPLRAFRTEMAEAAADGRYYCLTPVLVAAWKRTGGEIRPRSFVTSPLLLAAQMLGSYITAGTPSDDSAGASIALGDRRHANGMRGAR